MQLGKEKDALKLFERGLNLLEEAGLGRTSIAEAKVGLGYTHLRLGNKREAEKFLVEGVKELELEKAKVPGPAARAKKKLAILYFRVGKLHMAIKELLEAEAICREYGCKDQSSVKWLINSIISRFDNFWNSEFYTHHIKGKVLK